MVAFHETHITGPKITYLIVASKEISKKEYGEILSKKQGFEFEQP